MLDMAATEDGIIHWLLAAAGCGLAWLFNRSVKRMDDDIAALKKETELIGELSERVARVETRQVDMVKDVLYIRDRLDDQWGAKQPWSGRERRRDER